MSDLDRYTLNTLERLCEGATTHSGPQSERKASHDRRHRVRDAMRGHPLEPEFIAALEAQNRERMTDIIARIRAEVEGN
jgi:transcriptional regulator of NAD metabolism